MAKNTEKKCTSEQKYAIYLNKNLASTGEENQ